MDDSDIFSTPPKAGAAAEEGPKTPANQNTRFDAQEAREAALRRELDGVRKINEVMEGVIGTLERSRGNMGTVSTTVKSASTLLNTWTSILSQTEHNQRLILNPNWKGAVQDLVDVESEALRKQQDAERRAAESERRREQARQKVEEEERHRQTPATSRARGTWGTRSRGRGLTRGSGVDRGTSTGTSQMGDSSTSSIHSSRSGSGIGRGHGGTRGRGTRGVR